MRVAAGNKSIDNHTMTTGDEVAVATMEKMGDDESQYQLKVVYFLSVEEYYNHSHSHVGIGRD